MQNWAFRFLGIVIAFATSHPEKSDTYELWILQDYWTFFRCPSLPLISLPLIWLYTIQKHNKISASSITLLSERYTILLPPHQIGPTSYHCHASVFCLSIIPQHNSMFIKPTCLTNIILQLSLGAVHFPNLSP